MKFSRKFSILTKQKIVQYYKSGLKDQKQIRQEYGLSPTQLDYLVRWYNRYFLNPQKNYYQTQKSKAMGRPKKQQKKQTASAREKALEKQIKQLQKEKKELEKSLKWEEIKSQLFEKMVEVAERELELPIRKKFGTKQFEK